MALSDLLRDHLARVDRLRDVANASVPLHAASPEIAYEILAGSYISLYATFEAAYENLFVEAGRAAARLGPGVLSVAPGVSALVLEPTFRRLIRSEDAHRGLRTEGGSAAEARARLLANRLKRRTALFRPAPWRAADATIFRGSPTAFHVASLLRALEAEVPFAAGWDSRLGALYRRRNDYAHASEAPHLDTRLTGAPWGNVVTDFNDSASWLSTFMSDLADTVDEAIDALWTGAI